MFRNNKAFPRNIDVVIGGYPCQGYSELGKQCLDDERNFLYREFKRCLQVTQPKLF
ncbi:MAG: DNA cytosine methyltransferase [Promethearchaeota archaeon]